jgi:hypothetical protein
MLAGRNDIEFLKNYAKQMELYSDDGGITQPGAYGHRWRNYFGYDQLPIVIDELKKDPMTRRCVLTMWNGFHRDLMADTDTYVEEVKSDLEKARDGSKDVPCNTHVYFSLHTGKLDMTVCCRSNDIVWGAYGANAVHFSVLQEFVALAVGAPMGRMYQISNNYHAYIDRPDVKRLFDEGGAVLTTMRDLYVRGEVAHQHLFSFGMWEEFLYEVTVLLNEPNTKLQSYFLRDVVKPMLLAHEAHKAGYTAHGIEILEGDKEDPRVPVDWHLAGKEWLERRLVAKRQREGATA